MTCLFMLYEYQNNFHMYEFIRGHKLLGFSLGIEGVQINMVYKLLEIIWYLRVHNAQEVLFMEPHTNKHMDSIDKYC